MKLQVLFLTLSFYTTIQGQQSMPDFVLNSAKPYVYLQFDHVGPRKPLQAGEGNVGLWLRIVNNCREPITVPTFGLTSGDPGVGVFDEVIQNVVTTGVMDTSEIDLSDSSSPARTAVHPPQGYSAEVFSMTRVFPGKDLLFSVPLNHVDDQWFMRVRFVLDVNKPSLGTGPYTYLEFFNTQIPPGALASSGEAGTSPSTLMHEVDHTAPPKQQ
jgi:hypothetical protein